MNGETRPMIDARRFLNADLAEVEHQMAASGEVAVWSHRCPTKESPNEDSAAVIVCDDQSLVLAVADGAGGMRLGDQASRIAIDSLVSCIQQVDHEPVPLRSAIMNGFEAANASVLQLGSGASTTLAVVQVQGTQMRSYHVGDSMIVQMGQRGKLKWLTVSHSPVGYAVESGLMNETDAFFHEERHLVSNLVGSREMRIEVGPVLNLARRDTVLIGSDGLFDNYHVQQVIDQVRIGPLKRSIKSMTAELTQRIANGQDREIKPDDVTVIAYRPSGARSEVK